MLKLLFWLCLLGAVYSYFLYPLILRLIPRRKKAAIAAADESALPSMSLIVTAHNEAARIREKIENCLKIDYPGLEIVIASDASTDETDAIVHEFSGQGVLLARAEERKGKEYAQLQAINVASGDLIVFSDVATRIPEDALRLLAAHFSDPGVGAVSSEDRFMTRDGKLAGEGAYVKYEMWLRGLESERAGLVGLSGSFFAARREVCERWDIYSPSDFNTALNCATEGLIAVTAPDVLGYYQDVADPGREYQRKIRTIIRGMTALSRHPEVMSPSRYGLFAFQVFSHKLMRWLVPWFLALLLISSLMLDFRGGVYSLVLLAQVIFYGAVLAAHFKPALRDRVYFKVPYFFVQVNLATAHAGVQFIQGKRMTVWAPSQR